MKSSTIKRKAFSSFSVIVVFFALVIIGIAFIPTLDIRYQQSRTSPLLSVTYRWPNASPKVIENETSKIEGILGKINQVESVESISGIGSGYVTLRFDKHANMDEKRYEVSMLLRQLRSKLPEGMSYPQIRANIGDDEEVNQLFMALTLVGNASTYYIQKLAEQEVKPSLLKVAGIDNIEIGGSTPVQWEITFDPELMKSLSISPSEISSAINELGEKEFLGSHQDASGFTIPVLSSTRNVEPEKWGSLVIANKNGRVLKLSDVANIRLRDKPPTSYYRINGKNNITLRLSSGTGVNQVKLAQQVYQQLESIRADLPSGYSLLVSTDTTTYIKEELTKIGLRTLFSLIILLLFVLAVSRSWRILLILTISLISNLLIACVFYYIFKVEIHIYSLAAITVSFGIIIDNSIIMVSHLQKQKGLRVFISLMAATLTTLGALSVVFFLKEEQRLMLIDFTYVMLINLSVSLIVSLFFVPALMDKLYHEKSAAKVPVRAKRRAVRLSTYYSRFIHFGKRKRWAFMLVAILGFGLPLGSIPEEIEKDTAFAGFYNKTLGNENFKSNVKPVLEKIVGGALRLFTDFVYEGSYFNSDVSRTQLRVSGRMPDGCTVQQLNVAIAKMEQYISQFPEVEQFRTWISGYKSSLIEIDFTKEAEYSSFPFLLKSQLESKARSLGGMDWSVSGVGKGFNNSLGMDRRSTHILLTGYNYDQLYAYAQQLEKTMLLNERVKDTEINSTGSYTSDAQYEYILEVDKALLAMQELKYYDYISTFHTQLYGGNLNSYYNKTESQPVYLVSDQKDDYNEWDFYNMPVVTPRGQKKLSDAGIIDKRLVGKSIRKIDQVYQMYLNYNFNGPGQLGQMVQERAVDDINKVLPLGYKAQSSQSYSFWDRDKNQYYLLLLVILIIYFITAILFESLLKPLAVICLIPISFIGVFLTFYLFGFNFDQGGFASFILLSGLVVNAAIYIINDFNNLVARHNKPVNVATYLKAFNQKIIAITLTILSTVLGLVPFVVGQRETFWFAFAVGAMGGLIFSLLAIIIYLPLLLKLDATA